MPGWWSLGRIRGIPVRFHWSVIAGLLFFSGFHFAPGAWLGFLVVILVHELGHAAVVRATRQYVLGIDVHGLGGECRWAGDAAPFERSLIAWGGVAAQIALFVVALPVSWFVGPWLGRFGVELFYALTWSSLAIAALNLLPFGPFDGAEAWKLPRLWAERRRWRSSTPPSPRPATPGGAGGRDELARLFERIAADAREARRPR